MALKLEQKKAIVAEVNQVAANSLAMVAAEYRGLTVTEMTSLRSQARAMGVYIKVVPNNLARRALTDTIFECINERLVGPLVLAFTKEEPSAAARLVRDFAKEHEFLKAKALSISGKAFGSEQLHAVASLPTYEEALSKMLAVMKAPVEKFVRTLVQPHTKLVRTLAAVRDQKQAA